MANFIVLFIIGLIVALAVFKIVKDVKNGVKCSGCPDSKQCNCEH